MMLRSICVLFSLILAGSSLVAQERLRFVDPDGEPAKQVRYYTAIAEHARGGVGLDMMGDMGMGDMMGMGGMGGMGGMDDYGGAASGGGIRVSNTDAGSGRGGMGGMMGGMGGMDDEAMAGMMGSSISHPSTVFAFLGGDTIPLKSGMSAKTFAGDKEGTVPLASARATRTTRLRDAGLAVSSSGFAFLPPQTRVDRPVRLQPWQRFYINAPKNLNVDSYVVLACWRNGYAYPSLPDYFGRGDQSMTEDQLRNLDRWRFEPIFEWYQTGGFGKEIRMPPGEVRLTLIPKSLISQERTDLSRSQLQQLSRIGGPTMLTLLAGSDLKPLNIEFTQGSDFHVLTKRQSFTSPSASAVGNIEDKSMRSMPQWGDQIEEQYRVQRLVRKPTGGLQPAVLASVDESILRSNASASYFLNRERTKRSAFQSHRVARPVGEGRVRFDMMSPGVYQLQHRVDRGAWTETAGLEATQSDQFVLSSASSRNRFVQISDTRLSLVEEGSVTSSKSGPVQSQDFNREVSSVSKLSQIQTLRAELEQTIKRLLAHRKKLLEMERGLGVKSAEQADPFGSPGAGDGDPFGGSNTFESENPFVSDSDDPFASDANPFESKDDPFESGGANRFEEATDDPLATDDDEFAESESTSNGK